MTNPKIIFSKFLSAFRKTPETANTFEHTHTRIGNVQLNLPMGSYCIPSDKMDGMKTAYKNLVFNKTPETPTSDGAHLAPSGMEYLTERQLPNDAPIMIDLDLRYTPDVTERQHSSEHIDDMVEMYADVLSKLTEGTDSGSSSNEVIPLYVMQKDEVHMEKDKTKDGLHIMIGLLMDKAGQLLLRKKMIPELTNGWIDIPITNTWDDVIDEAVSKRNANWQLYGSRKPGFGVYRVTQYYELATGVDGKLTVSKKNLRTVTLDTVLRDVTVRNTNFTKRPIRDTYKSEYDAIVRSIGSNRPNRIRAVDDTESGDQLTPNSSSGGMYSSRYEKQPYPWSAVRHITSEEILDTEIDAMINAGDRMLNNTLRETHLYTMLLAEEYWGEGTYAKWYSVGLALRNTDQRLFLTWVRMSCKSDSFVFETDFQDLYLKWCSMPLNNSTEITNRSIMFWARSAEPDEYKRIKNSMLTTYIQDVIRAPNEDNIANIMKHMFKDEWVCTSISHNVWYQFVDGRWQENECGTGIRRLISGPVHDVFFRYLQEEVLFKTNHSPQGGQIVNNSIIQSANASANASAANTTIPRGNVTTTTQQFIPVDAAEDKDENKELVNQLSNICGHVKRTAWKNNIMKELQEKFYDREFMNKLDANPRLMGFKNGVVDFDKKVFRQGQPEDYLSMCAGCAYTPLSELTSPAEIDLINEVKTFITELFPNKSLCEYMWDHLASILIGNNINNVFNIYTGTGANGKSAMVDLLTVCLADYKGVVPLTLVTQKRTSIGSTTPEIAQLKRVRFAVMQESSKGDKLNEGILKELTGGDDLQARALYRDSVTFRPQFKLCVCTNTLFDISAMDDGTWRRIHVNPFESKFHPDPYNNEKKFPVKEYPHQFKVVKRLDNKFPKWAPILMAILVDRAYTTDGHVGSCELVESHCEKYRMSQDYLMEFVTECVRETEGDRLTKTDAKEEFKRWYQDTHGKPPPSIRELTEYMDKKYGKYQKGGWRNIGIVYDDDEDDFISTDVDCVV